ncbi:MAG: type IV toxin-antitoxin system AbiEi family antitoxin domain-containing protein [Candidatus Brocadiales bacterium]|nr:type IV toxin-antitoxin system AbiEi family antitoxin domain-containing protein [Candidatus Brocadiales bacterium]
MDSKIRERLLFSPPFSCQEAISSGITRSMLHYYLDEGVIRRVDRGIYQGKKYDFDGDIQLEEMIVIASKTKGAVLCLISALTFYDLTDEMMRHIWLAVPRSFGAKKKDGMRYIRYRNMELGLLEIEYAGIKFKIFDKERTVIDCFRYLDLDLSLNVLKNYLRKSEGHKPNIEKLMEYSEALRKPIHKYVEAILA